MNRLVRLGTMLLVTLVAIHGSPGYATFHWNCPPDVRGCSVRCCYICYLTSVTINSDYSYDCEYDDCYTNCV
jgi:hypothetical protein